MPRPIQQRQATSSHMQPPVVTNPPPAAPSGVQMPPPIRRGQVATNSRTQCPIDQVNNAPPAAPSREPTPHSTQQGRVPSHTRTQIVNNPPSATPLPAPVSRPSVHQRQAATSRTEPPIVNNSHPVAPSREPMPRSTQQRQPITRTTTPIVDTPPSAVPLQSSTPRPTQQEQVASHPQPPIINSPIPDVPSQAPKRRRTARTTVYVREPEFEIYYQLGKMIPRLVHPFLPVHQLLYYGTILYTVTLQNAEDDNDDEGLELGSETELMDPSDKETILSAFTILIGHAPWLKEAMTAAIEDKPLLRRIEQYVSKGSSQAHSDDSSGLKQACVQWIQEDLTTPLEPPIQGNIKAGRGFHHPVLSKMLCPGSKQEKLEDDHEYINELKLGNISDEDFPTFCYKDDFCDPLDVEAGLFRGIFLLRTFRRIFTGPSSVLTKTPGPTSKRKSNADIIGLMQVTPRSIAYAVVQARLVLSDKESWDQCDGIFNYRHFYESIVSVFETDPELPWVKETLKWWNKEVLLPSSHAKAIQTRTREGSPSMVQRLKEQRERAQRSTLGRQPEEHEEPEERGLEGQQEPEEPVTESESVTEPESEDE